MRALVTGAAGFAGGYLCAALAKRGVRVFGTFHDGRPSARGGVAFSRCDLAEPAVVTRLVRSVRPGRIYHLAAESFVPAGETDPARMWRTNVQGTWNLLRAAADWAPGARVLYVGSSEVYGRSGLARRRLREVDPLRPATLYAASKGAAEMLASYFAQTRGLFVVRVRPFNHTGPGQDDRFLCAGLARQVAAAERARRPGVVVLGNLHPVRDYMDVRDTVRAYLAALERGESGEVYNVASGSGRTVRQVAEVFLRLSRVPLRCVSRTRRRRTVDLPRLVGDPGRISRRTGFRPRIEFRETARAMLDRLRAAPH